jgi:hypothetical protein
VRPGAAAAIVAGVALAAVAVGAPRGARPPETNYLLVCSGCHLRDGAGLPHAGIPRMKDKLGYFLRSDAGRAFLVQVPGTSSAPLTDREVAELLNWMLARFSPAEVPASAAPYTESEVTVLRARRMDDVAAIRARVVQELRRTGAPID